MPRKWKISEYQVDAERLAVALLGQHLVRIVDGARLVGRIVEVEAYLGEEDRAAHSFGGRRTARVEPMYLPGGHSYVYFTYGMHWCMNVVADAKDVPSACLIRALEPVKGESTMMRHRTRPDAKRTLKPRDLCSGPAKLCQAMAIDGDLNAVDLTRNHELWIEKMPTVDAGQIATGPRVGIGYAEDWVDKPLRYWIRDSRFVSRR